MAMSSLLLIFILMLFPLTMEIMLFPLTLQAMPFLLSKQTMLLTFAAIPLTFIILSENEAVAADSETGVLVLALARIFDVIQFPDFGELHKESRPFGHVEIVQVGGP